MCDSDKKKVVKVVKTTTKEDESSVASSETESSTGDSDDDNDTKLTMLERNGNFYYFRWEKLLISTSNFKATESQGAIIKAMCASFRSKKRGSSVFFQFLTKKITYLSTYQS